MANGPCCVYGKDVPYGEAQYDPAAADVFFRERPLAALKRMMQITSLSGSFVLSTILDKQLGREEQMVAQRSGELLELVTKLGPTFIKIGQALSIRTDLLPAPYVAGLTELQDNVQPFDASEGRDVIEAELGIKLETVFSEISLEPVASASIGQVYKGRLRESGEWVAVKVQRPNVLYDVALDLFMLRFFAPAYQEANEINTDLVGLIDAWGSGFVNELDYRREAAATKAFAAAMEERGLGSVTAPTVIDELSSTHVLTTKWVDGERLASSKEDDVPRLCGVALNAYLTMLLDTGSLHCDPHPGNLLRTPDGKLCILDFGMVLDVPTDLQLSLLEFIANLQAENYEDVPDDLVNLGFVPADKIGELRSSGLTVAIASMLRLAAAGGGPSGAMKRMVEENKAKYAAQLSKFDDLDSPEATKERQRLFREDWQRSMAEDAMKYGSGGVQAGAAAMSTTADLTAKIEQMQQENSNVFAIPEYFVYMSRAFSTLEGIGLSVDPNYAILSECFPYLAKRLLSDDSPRARGALRTLLYGKSDELNLEKLTSVANGLESYTVSTTSVQSSTGASDAGRKQAAEQLAAVLLAEDGNFVQELLLREAAVALDAAVRDEVFKAIAPFKQVRSSLPPLPPRPPLPLRPLVAPLTLPLELASAALEVQRMDAKDTKRLENLRVLLDLAGFGGRRAGAADAAPSAALPPAGGGLIKVGGADETPPPPLNRLPERVEQLRWLATEAAARRTALGRTGLRFGSTLASAQAERLRQRGKEATAGDLSSLAGRLAAVGAISLEGVARVAEEVDRGLAADPAEGSKHQHDPSPLPPRVALDATRDTLKRL